MTLQWIEEVRSICGRSIPVLLVACKTDLREKAKANGTFSPDRYIDRETVSRGYAGHRNEAYDRVARLRNPSVREAISKRQRF